MNIPVRFEDRPTLFLPDPFSRGEKIRLYAVTEGKMLTWH